MRFSGLLLCLSALAFACTDSPCEDKAGRTNCGYCSQDRLATSNPHAGMCRYCGEGTYCTGNICTDELACVRRVNVFIPKATFHKGKAPVASAGTRAPAVKRVAPTSGSVTTHSPVSWTVEWEVTVVVTAIYFEVARFDGYYEIPVTQEEANAGSIQVLMSESTDVPGESGCLGPTTCWTEAPESTTTSDSALSLVAGGEVGQPQGGIGLTWEEPSYSQTTTPDPDPGDGCATSGAQLGCCTTSGGIQKVGVWVSASCRCPSDTCGGSGNYCGCPACGGCQ